MTGSASKIDSILRRLFQAESLERDTHVKIPLSDLQLLCSESIKG